MQKVFSHTFLQNIWRILPHPDSDRNEWAIELREITEKKISFALIDLDGGAVKWISYPEGVDWWSSITGFGHNQIYIHHNRYPDLPEPTDLSALSVDTGKLLWTLPDCVLVRTIDQRMIQLATRQPGAVHYVTAYANTGEVVPEEDRRHTDTVPGIILKQPIRYSAGKDYFAMLSSFLKNQLDVSNPVCIDYLDCRPYMIFSYYIYEQEKVAQYLVIFSSNREMVLHEKLADGRDGVGQSTILLRGGTLVYLCNSNEFRSLKLS